MIIRILLLTSLDLITKMLAVHFQSAYLVYNEGMGLGLQNTWVFQSIDQLISIDLLFFVKFIFPVIAVPIMIIGLKEIYDKSLRNYAIVFFMSCFLGNYISRFNPQGVVDFIPMPLTKYIFNLADFYSVIVMFILVVSVIKSYRQEQTEMKIA